MKKIITLSFILSFCNLFSQMKINDSIIVPIKESAGIKIIGVYKLLKIKNDKKEYQIHVYYKNTNDETIVYKNSTNNYYFAKCQLKGSEDYVFRLDKIKISENTFLLEPKKQYKCESYYEKWYNGNDIPEFTNIDIEFNNSKKEIVSNVTIPSGTIIKASLINDINGKDLSIGDKLDFILAADILIDGKIAIPAYSKIIGTVTDAKGSRMLGKKGKLAFTIDYLYYKNNVIKLQSQFDKNLKGSGDRKSVV